MPNIDQVQLPDGSQYNLKDNTSGYVTAGYVDDVIDGLTKANVGLGNVDNTSDLNKPVSTAQQTALNGKTDTTVIAPTEATTTASRRYEIGEQFILNGVLYTATAVIASGDSIIVDTNCDLSESITEQIDEVNAKTSGLMKMTTLWTNPSPTASFSAQNITLADGDYNFLTTNFSVSVGFNNKIYKSVTVEKGQSVILDVGRLNYQRVATYISDTSYNVGSANDASATNDNVCVPISIYGIKII